MAVHQTTETLLRILAELYHDDVLVDIGFDVDESPPSDPDRAPLEGALYDWFAAEAPDLTGRPDKLRSPLSYNRGDERA